MRNERGVGAGYLCLKSDTALFPLISRTSSWRGVPSGYFFFGKRKRAARQRTIVPLGPVPAGSLLHDTVLVSGCFPYTQNSEETPR